MYLFYHKISRASNLVPELIEMGILWGLHVSVCRSKCDQRFLSKVLLLSGNLVRWVPASPRTSLEEPFSPCFKGTVGFIMKFWEEYDEFNAQKDFHPVMSHLGAKWRAHTKYLKTPV